MKKLFLVISLVLLSLMLIVQGYFIKTYDFTNNIKNKNITSKETEKETIDISNIDFNILEPTFILKEMEKNKEYVNLCYNVRGDLKDINEGVKYFSKFNGRVEELNGHRQEDNSFSGEIVIRIDRVI
ncbi:hypothetical protein [Clostridium sp.]|uniref:hypothetical protein n=1 Tax=Clostridium sp. TaxID=1506 RepID=UPI003464CF6D